MWREWDSKLTKRMMRSDESSERTRGRPHVEWMNYVKRALNERGMTVQQARAVVDNRGERRTTVMST